MQLATLWSPIICHVHFICLWYSEGGLSRCGLYTEHRFTSPRSGGNKVKVIESAPKRRNKKKKEKEDKWESESCVTVLHAAEKERGWTSEPLREASELWSGMWGGNWWPYFSGCASASTSFWEQNRWTGTQIWNLISGYNDALMQCVCVKERDSERVCVCCLPSLPWLPSLFSICTAPTYFFNWTFRTSFSLHKHIERGSLVEQDA